MNAGNLMYPTTFDEQNLAGDDVHIRPEDIADYAYPPGKRERYTDAGWDKAIQLQVATLRPEDFGAISDGRSAQATPGDRLLGLLDRELTREDLRALPDLAKLRRLLDHWHDLAALEEERRANTPDEQPIALGAREG